MTTGTSEFIEAELDRLANEIRQVEQRIAEVKNENTGSLPEDMDANQRMLERAASDLRLAQRDLAIAESDAAFYRQQSATGASDRYGYAGPDTPSERKARLELALGEAMAKGWTERHPDVIALREEIAALETTARDNAAGMEEQLSPEQQLSDNEAKRAELRAQSARAEMGRLSAQVADVEASLARTPQVAEQLAALERQHEHLYGSFQEFSAKRLEAGVSANMERRQKGEQFRILEAAFPPSHVASPNRLLILTLGLLLGLAAGAGAALFLEIADSSVHGARELQALFQLPVLASIPRVLLESDRVLRRRRRVLAGALAVGLTFMVLAGAGAGYWIVNVRPESAASEVPPGVAPPAAQGTQGARG
jgi:uncharacterized protein involved in exopolysaccharide biosynthesis